MSLPNCGRSSRRPATYTRRRRRNRRSGIDNATVIAELKNLIEALQARLAELQTIQGAPGGPLEERADRQMQIFARISSINIRILHLQNRLHDRELAAAVGEAVPPLSEERRQAMRAALEKVNQSIVAIGMFKDAIALAEEISKAASSAADATAV